MVWPSRLSGYGGLAVTAVWMAGRMPAPQEKLTYEAGETPTPQERDDYSLNYALPKFGIDTWGNGLPKLGRSNFEEPREVIASR